MGQLVHGEWITGPVGSTSAEFERTPSRFRDWITADGARRPEPDRYHLYVSLACPWAHRTLIARTLGGLEKAIRVWTVEPFMGDNGWELAGERESFPSAVKEMRYLRELYVAAHPDCTSRVTVPVLWDSHDDTIVNNESSEIIRMFDRVMAPALGVDPIRLFCEELGDEVDAMIEANYDTVNNAVYRCGFAGSQAAYDRAVTTLFGRLDALEELLSTQRYLVGDGSRLSAADVCLFVTLYRFDAVYNCHFKCNKRRIVDYPSLWGFTRDIYQLPGVAETCDMDHVREHYYRSHETINPRRIVAVGPELDFAEPHGRDSL